MRDLLENLEHGDPRRDPMRTAQEAMRPRLPKRFYQHVAVAETDGGYQVLLDGRAIKTPGKNPTTLRIERLAIVLASEFDVQKDVINPALMPFYRLLNTAIDGVATDLQAVREDVLRFAGSDLICYRAEGPEPLAMLQAEHWDGPVDWVATITGVPMALAQGIVHVTQPKAVIAGLGVVMAQIDDPLEVAALHSMTSLTGSAVLALGVAKAQWDAQTAWAAAHVDEDYNIQQWGHDSEAEKRRANRWLEMQAAARVFEELA